MNIESRKRKNRITVATYNSLFADNKDKQKSLITITLGDEKLTSLFNLRRELISEIRKILRRVKYLDTKFAYFTNIELGFDKGNLSKQFNPHLHVQVYYTNYHPIKLALSVIEKKYHFKNFDIQHANEKDAYFGYVIKDYVEKNFDATLEENKMLLGMKQQFYTKSRKEIPDYVIRYIYHYYKINAYQVWKPLSNREHYQFILDNIRDSIIIIKPSKEQLPAKFKTVKNYKIYIKI